MISKFLRRQQLSRWFNITLFQVVGGKRFKIPVFSKMGTGNYFMTELWMLGVLQRLLPGRTGVFVDIGANIGQTLIKLRSVSTDTAYVGIEPNPACIFYLRELIRQNHFQQCTLIPAGIYPESDLLELTFLNDDEVDSSAMLHGDLEPNPGTLQNQFVALLPFHMIRERLKLDSICIVKVDVEGAELEVLESLAATLDDLSPPLLIEILPLYTQDNVKGRERQEKVEALLAEHGYLLARICKTQAGQLAGIQPIDEIGIHSDLSLCDYLAYPAGMRAAILAKFAML